MHLRRERAEPRLVGRDLARQGQAHHRAAMEATAKRNHRGSARVGPDDLHRVLHRFGAGSEEGGLDWVPDRDHLVDSLCQRDRTFVGDDLESGMHETVELATNRLQHARMPVTGVQDSNAGGEVQVLTSFHVLECGVGRLVCVNVA